MLYRGAGWATPYCTEYSVYPQPATQPPYKWKQRQSDKQLILWPNKTSFWWEKRKATWLELIGSGNTSDRACSVRCIGASAVPGGGSEAAQDTVLLFGDLIMCVMENMTEKEDI